MKQMLNIFLKAVQKKSLFNIKMEAGGTLSFLSVYILLFHCISFITQYMVEIVS